MMSIIIFGAIAIAWKWELIGGILLIIIGMSGINLPVFMFPLLASGIVFIISWREGRQFAEKATGTGEASRRDRLWVFGLYSGILGAVVFTLIAIGMFIAKLDYWFLLPIAPVFWSGVALARKRKGLGGIVQIVASPLAPFVFGAAFTKVEPDSWAVLGPVFLAILFCTIPFLVSGILIISSGGRGGKPQEPASN